LSELFVPAKKAFIEQDTKAGKTICRRTHDLGQKCEVLIRQLLNLQGDFSPQEAVAYVLLARHYKRVSGHLSNIASGVVSSLPLLDFRNG
jgi:phosphate uptake regulator